jgi:uncharacterized protein YfaS (alpha-2-macroglobulin family)
MIPSTAARDRRTGRCSGRRRYRGFSGGSRPGWPRLFAIALAFFAVVPPAFAADTRVAGRVIDADTQKPIAGADVELSNAYGGTGYFRTKTGRDGAFRIDRVVAERFYTLSVGADGYADFTLGDWRIPQAQRAAELTVPLDRAGSIEVRVTGTGGRGPIANARVSIRNEGFVPWWEASRPPAPRFTDATGVTRFDALKAGSWTVVVEASGLLTQEVRRVAVRRGEITRVPATASRPARITGAVRLADGTAVEGVSVIARGPSEGVGTSGPDGAFTIEDLAPGKYRVEVQHEGFKPARAKETITIAEGGARGGVALVVTPRPPELAFVLEREVFGLEDRVKVALRAFRVGELTVSLWRVPYDQLIDPSRDFRRAVEGRDTTGFVRVTTFSHRTPDGPPYAWREEELLIPGELEPGVYVLGGRAGDAERRTLFFVSDLGLVIKRSPTRALVSVASLKTGLAIPGAAVFAVPLPAGSSAVPSGNRWSEALAAARAVRMSTDADGLLMVPITGGPARVRIVAASEKHGVAVAEAPLAPAAEQGGDKVFLYTERPIYRPGQTVFWKLFARKASGLGYAMPDASTATLSFTGPDGATLDVPAATLSPRGSADGAIELPKDAAIGEWTLQATVGRGSATTGVGVQAYRKPEFQVEVTPAREVYVNGDEVRFQVAATYFFGAPVFGATVRYNLFESRLGRVAESDEEDFEPTEVGFGRVLKTGEARTDLDGRVALTFTPERVAYDRRLTLEVEVVDASSRVVRGRGSAVMGRGLFNVAVEPVSRMVLAGQPVVVEVRTRDHAGKAVSAAVTVELDQEAWNPIERRYTRSTRPLASTQVTTDTSGRARVSLSPQPARAGNVIVRARAEDSKGNRITDEASVWVYDPKVWQYAYRYPSIEAFPDRERYQPGDSARIVVNTEVAYAAVLATVEGRELADYRVVHLFGNTGLVTIPIRAAYAPNVFVSLIVRKGKEVLSRTLELPVEQTRHDLDIKISTDRAEYRPRDQATIRIETRDRAGQPLPAEVSVGVVDEAIYGLRPDRTPDPHDVFYGRRPNWVTTVVSFPILYFGGADKGGRDEVRRDFRDVAAWEPTVITDASGKGEVRVRFPDNLTTWRITSRGMTTDTRVGRAVAKTLVTKDLVARLATPRFLIGGDEASLVSVVTNRTAAPLSGVEQSIEARGPVKGVGAARATASIPAGGESRREWRFEASRDLAKLEADTAAATFTFRAHTASDADALELPVPLLPRAVAVGAHGAGVVEAASLAANVSLPSNLIKLGSRVTLDLSPSPAAMALAASEALASFPWACTEQTANAIRPASAMIAAFARAKVTVPGWAEPVKRLEPFVARLTSLQHADGGWGWWESDESDPYLTVLALDALARAEAAGVTSGQNALANGINQIGGTLYAVRSLDGEAYALAHLVSVLELTDAKTRFPELRSRLEELALAAYSSRDRLSTSGLAMAARAHAVLGRAAEARTLLDLLMSRAIPDSPGRHWPADPGFEDAWFGADEENTAYALSALVTIAPNDGRARDVVQWLARRRRGTMWRSTRVTAPVAIALADYLEQHPVETKPSYTLAVDWNGARLLDRAIGEADVFGGRDLRITVPGSQLKPGINRLGVTKRGEGVVYYAWAAQSMVPSDHAPDPGKQPVKITREYLHAERTTDRRGRTQYLSTPFVAGAPIKLGEQILVRITLETTKPLHHLIVEDPRLAGFEVDDLSGQGLERPWDLHAGERDDRVAFFLREVDQGETVIEYLVRPEITGAFAALPASVSGMYDPELRARSVEGRMEVGGK